MQAVAKNAVNTAESKSPDKDSEETHFMRIELNPLSGSSNSG